MRLTPALAGLLLVCSPAAISAQEDTESADPAWEISLLGGMTAFSGDQEQPFGSLSIKHDFGNVYISLGGTIAGYNGPDPVPGGTIPATTKQIILGAGYENEAFALDSYVAYGDRDFDDIPFMTANGTPVTFEADGDSWAAGVSLTYQFALGGDWYASPTATLDYSEISTAQIATGPRGGFIARDIEESGVTGSGGVTLQYAFGEARQHSLGLYGGAVATSNGLAATQIAGSPAGTTAPERIDGLSDGDFWFEYGASGSFGLSDTVIFDLSISRTAGLEFGEATTGAAGLTFLF